MDTRKFKTSFMSGGFLVIAFLAFSAVSRAQSPSPSPSPGTSGDRYNFISSVELGIRGLEVNGDHEKYRSDLNYHPGFRIFDSSLLIEDKGTGAGTKLFDSLYTSATGWGADPASSFRLNFSKTGVYKIDSNIRRVQYYNNLKNFAVNYGTPFPNQSEHQFDTKHHFGDFDLTIFPERDKFRMRFGYSFNNTEGPGFYTLRFRSDEFQVNQRVNTKSQDLRAGVEGQIFGFNVGGLYGHRVFRDKTRFFVDSFNIGNNTTPGAALVNYTRLYPTKGTVDFGNFYAQRTFAKRLDFTARFIYAEARSVFDQSDFGNGFGAPPSTGQPPIIVSLDQIFANGQAKRPQTRADLGLTYRVTDKLRVSNTFNFDQFSISGGNNFTEVIQNQNGNGTPRPDILTNTFAWRTTSYRRFTNLIEADYQFGPWLGVNAGYRFTHRDVTLASLDRNFISRSAATGEESANNDTHALVAGVKVKPTKYWSIYGDIDWGESDNVFTRLANNDYLYLRVRSLTHLNKFTINLSAITKDNDNPGTTTPQANVPSFEATARQRSRFFSGDVEWNMSNDYNVAGGYTYNYQSSNVDVIVPVGPPYLPSGASNTFFRGTSEYFVRDSFFHFDVYAHPIKWMSAYISYRIDDDRGQGDRRVTRPQDIISSYPMRYQSPEVRLAFRLTKYLDWNVGYQYYDYKEKPVVYAYVGPNSTGSQTLVATNPFIAQNYSAHLPYTSLRIHWGGREEVR